MRFLRTRLVQVLIDAGVVCVAFGLAYAFRFEGFPPRLYWKQFLLILPYLVGLRLILFGTWRVYRLVWRYISLRDLPRIFGATLSGTLILVGVRFLLAPLFHSLGLVINRIYATVPWGVMAAELILTTAGLVAVRALWRVTTEEARRKGNGTEVPRETTRALLIGAGSAGVMVAREAISGLETGFAVAGFLDDDPVKHGKIIHGFRVLGATDRLPEFSRKLKADLAIITMGRAPAPAVRKIVGLAEATSMRVQIIPNLDEILSGRVAVSKVRDVAIEDLLGREPVDLDEDLIQRFITGKTVLVTGAGGSIGSEICRQVCRFDPEKLVLLDQAENPLFHIHRELRELYPGTVLVPRVGDVTERDRMSEVLRRLRPEVIFHAAAHKHVPLMEENVGEAIRNNVGGSRLMADLAHQYGVESFVMISTDKAVNPSSVMGATKRLAEIYIQALAAESRTRFTTVRFGNVLASEGSVVPLFKEQIARGGPVTVTHPDMKRYFMTIPEASQLVLQASTMGKGGEIFVLEMGEPIHIVALARDLIRLSGFRPGEDIEIAFTGVRPGEKLSEEISLSEENATKTRHPRIWIGKSSVTDLTRVSGSIERLLGRLHRAESDDLRSELASMVPEYTPNHIQPAEPSGRDDPQAGPATLPNSA